MEDICLAGNAKEAMRKVIANKGSAGVDGMTFDELPEDLKHHWLNMRQELLEGCYCEIR